MDRSIETSVDPAKPRRGWLARFARDRRGVAALEFGMVSVPFLGLLCAIFETAFVFYTQEVFDNAVATVSRQILVNQYASSGTTPTAYDWVNGPAPSGSNGYFLCGNGGLLPAYFNCSNIRVNVQANATLQSVPLESTFWANNPNTTPLNLGTYQDYVTVQAFYPMPIYLSVLMASGATGNGATNLYSTASSSAVGGVVTNPVTGSGLVHNIYTVLVFRNEPQ